VSAVLKLRFLVLSASVYLASVLHNSCFDSTCYCWVCNGTAKQVQLNFLYVAAEQRVRERAVGVEILGAVGELSS
jgi:hypothetical protein